MWYLIEGSNEGKERVSEGQKCGAGAGAGVCFRQKYKRNLRLSKPPTGDSDGQRMNVEPSSRKPAKNVEA